MAVKGSPFTIGFQVICDGMLVSSWESLYIKESLAVFLGVLRVNFPFCSRRK